MHTVYVTELGISLRISLMQCRAFNESLRGNIDRHANRYFRVDGGVRLELALRLYAYDDR